VCKVMAVKTLPSDPLAQASEFAKRAKVTMECSDATPPAASCGPQSRLAAWLFDATLENGKPDP
jgi:hypothetical protein